MKNSSTPNKRLNEFQINICGWKEGKKNLIDLFLFIRFPLISEKNENRISLITHNINDVPGTHSIHKMINWVFRFSVVLTVTAMIICCPFRIIHYVIHFNVIIQHFGAWKIITKKTSLVFQIAALSPVSHASMALFLLRTLFKKSRCCCYFFSFCFEFIAITSVALTRFIQK